MESIMPRDRETIVKALAENARDIFLLPGHESIWHHRRFLLQSITDEFAVPDGWAVGESPVGEFTYPIARDDRELNAVYGRICDAFCISINLILVQPTPEKTVVDIDLRNEDLVIEAARSDRFPCEFLRQQLAAEKHFRWLRCRFVRRLRAK
jgi:hypothetical protein